MLDFYVGQKVVCVDADVCDYDGRCQLVQGKIYTVRACGQPPDWQVYQFLLPAGAIGVLLEEVHRHQHELLGECGEAMFSAARFRPLIETNISVFQAMLAPKPAKQREGENA